MILNYARHSLGGRDGKNIIIMITDGVDNCDKNTLPVEYKKIVKGTVDYRKQTTEREANSQSGGWSRYALIF